MSATITLLRKEGKLDEAFDYGLQQLEANPTDIWILRALSWVLYDKVKLAISQAKHPEIIQYHQQITHLSIPAEESMFWENLSKQTLSYAWVISKQGKVNELYELVNSISPQVVPKGSNYYSSIVQTIIRCIKEGGMINETVMLLLEWVDSTAFIAQDYMTQQVEGIKHSLKPLVESYYNIYAKVLYQKKDNKRIEDFIPRLKAISQSYPSYIWCGYNMAKLMTLLGNSTPENIRQNILPLVKSQHKQFWVWEAYADTYPPYSEERFSLLAQAMLCPMNSPEMTINLRKAIIKELHHRKLYNPARKEIDEIIRIRREQGWRDDPTINECLSRQWYISAQIETQTKPIYKELSKLAEQLVFGEQSTIIAVIHHINESKSIANVITATGDRSFFSFKKLKGVKLEKGKIYELAIRGDITQMPYTVIDARLKPDTVCPDLIQRGQGLVKILPSGVAFIHNAFVKLEEVKQHKLRDGERVSYTAFRNWDKQKESLSWCVREINREEQ